MASEALARSGEAKRRGDGLHAAQRYPEALQEFAEALRVLDQFEANTPEMQEEEERKVGIMRTFLLQNKASCYHRMKRHQDAITACTSALEEDPCCDQAMLLRARCHLETSDWAAAYRDFSAVLDAKPNMQEAREKISWINTHYPAVVRRARDRRSSSENRFAVSFRIVFHFVLSVAWLSSALMLALHASDYVGDLSRGYLAIITAISLVAALLDPVYVLLFTPSTSLRSQTTEFAAVAVSRACTLAIWNILVPELHDGDSLHRHVTSRDRFLCNGLAVSSVMEALLLHPLALIEQFVEVPQDPKRVCARLRLLALACRLFAEYAVVWMCHVYERAYGDVKIFAAWEAQHVNVLQLSLVLYPVVATFFFHRHLNELESLARSRRRAHSKSR
ncbi:hypothetical protein GUITHDRAFT_166914 [Guillardia theta CCMP2712]|uniref:Uncharacterized protein n=1 Tax=Guillardia theta (strain CCMP2712) TaxID=905079 RepID=L1I533_GUITC|nr:hypothetical protein GUITHDRAFT_166914 [Guillardia theta CCMP2712]EKX31326.1 hypothetical protein GUITHDRAFT_166914 [Guillardia theta CCMP2712]|eukprot:XP_005818306.1 hypothetical protein GUITHDRAFT_166914 [Guillardia theta CCMP2712]